METPSPCSDVAETLGCQLRTNTCGITQPLYRSERTNSSLNGRMLSIETMLKKLFASGNLYETEADFCRTDNPPWVREALAFRAGD